MGGAAWSAGRGRPAPPIRFPNSQSPLEIITSFRGARLGSRGLMRSSTVTAAMALMLVEAVLSIGWGGWSTGLIKGLATPLSGVHLLGEAPAAHTI